MKEIEEIFDLHSAPRVLVEASAGTGKTYTIVGIFVRLLFEKNLNVDQILAVTFTKKATAELRERILKRLRDTLETLQHGISKNEDDLFLTQLDKIVTDKAEAVEKLRRAIHNFDDSQVFTIHGFCQKILQEEALLAGTPFEMELNPADKVTKKAAEDFWRVFIHENSTSDAGRYLITKLLSIVKSPDELLGNNGGIGPLLSKRYADPEGKVLDDPKKWLQKVIDVRNKMKSTWENDREKILEILRNCDVKYYQSALERRTVDLEKFLSDQTFSEDEPRDLDRWTCDYLYDSSKLKKNGRPVPEHDFFAHCEMYMDQISEMKKVETTLLDFAYRDIVNRRDNLSSQTETVSYDDLLIKVSDAFTDPVRGAKLADKLRKRYPIALVDEFQDTDPIQYEIFNQIYAPDGNDNSLMMIGDPKQAIYAFRGADLHTYYKASKDGEVSEYTLSKNYRSTVDYIGAINALFSGVRNPFIEIEIEFRASKAGRPDHNPSLLIRGRKEAALQVKAVEGVEGNKENLAKKMLDITAQKIAELLALAQKGEAAIGEETIKAGDIAVLIARHKDASFLQQKLKEYGVDSVTKTNQSIFETLEANRLEMLMNAVLHPLNPKVLNAGLLSGFFGLDLRDLYELKSDEAKRQKLIDELSQLRGIWKRRGFYAMFYELIHRENRLLNFARLKGAERVITNLYQLADLCAAVERDEHLGPGLLHTWLLRQMQEAEESDENELQLESDQHLVKIMTIHASKGLQFPLVFCPALWVGREPEAFKNKAERPVEYHKKNESRLTINIDREKSQQRQDAEYLAGVESAAEEVRKTYVALTRAQYGCFIFWGTHSNSNFSGLGASILGREEVVNSIRNQMKVKEDGQLSDETFLDWFKQRTTESDGKISLEIVESQDEAGVQDYFDTSDKIPEPAEYSGRLNLPVRYRMESFSSLAGHNQEPGEPDYDQVLEKYTEAIGGGHPSQQMGKRNIFQFPRGTTAGTAIHKLFEHEDFGYNKLNETEFNEHIISILEQYNFDSDWSGILFDMMKNVAGAEIPGLDLGKLIRENELREMEFNFSASGADGEALLNVIRDGKHLNKTNSTAKMSMTGFIDLVARQDGRYYILDYKSNYLGDVPEDYHPDKLEHVMISHSYDLQYHIYTVALVKYLRTRLKEFDYEKHYGGAAYLFVRGMKAGSTNGVYFRKPKKETIDKLEAILKNPGPSPENGDV